MVTGEGDESDNSDSELSIGEEDELVADVLVGSDDVLTAKPANKAPADVTKCGVLDTYPEFHEI